MRFILIIISIILLGTQCASNKQSISRLTSYEYYCLRVHKNKVLQKKLKSMGYYTGRVDGILGRKTRIAIMKLQRKRGIKETGVLDPQTKQALNR